eukprot:12290737-Alexandrium_andersonii.AAC.1
MSSALLLRLSTQQCLPCTASARAMEERQPTTFSKLAKEVLFRVSMLRPRSAAPVFGHRAWAWARAQA